MLYFSKNRLQHLGPKKGGLFFDVECAIPKTQRPFVALCYSPCDDTPTAATVALTAGGVSLPICKNILFISVFPLAVHSRSDTPPVVLAMVAAVGVSSQGL